uniref:Uncharacterized protein n=1 Tax=Plectus sambesii TaxID=2011161 RepID=A0A914WDF0_9BILA
MAIGVGDNWQASALRLGGCCAIWSSKRAGRALIWICPRRLREWPFVVSAVYRATAPHTTDRRQRHRWRADAVDGFLLAIEWPGDGDRFVFGRPASRRPSRIIIPVSRPRAHHTSEYCWTAASECDDDDDGLIVRTATWRAPYGRDGGGIRAHAPAW